MLYEIVKNELKKQERSTMQYERDPFMSSLFDLQKFSALIASGKNCIVTINGKKRHLPSSAVLTQGADTSSLQGVFKKEQLAFTLTAAPHKAAPEYMEFSFSITNNSEQPVSIGSIDLFSFGDESGCQDGSGRVLYGFHNDLGDAFVEPVTAHKGIARVSPMCLIYDKKYQQLFFSAQSTFNYGNWYFHLQFNRKTSALKKMVCTFSTVTYELQPGETISPDRLCLYLGGNVTSEKPYALLTQWADFVSAYHQVKLPETAPAGFITGLMTSPKGESSVSQIRRQLSACKQLRGLGLEYLWISIDNLQDSLTGNWLNPSKQNFPGGLPEFLHEVTECGIKPGLWFGVFYFNENTPFGDTMIPYSIHTRDGVPASRGRWLWGPKDEEGQLPRLYALDPASPEALAAVKNVLETYAKWGVRYYMFDFLSAGLYHEGERNTGYGQSSYLKFLRKLPEYTAPGTHILSASGTSLNLLGAGTASRIGADYGEGRPLEKQFPSYPASYVINGSYGSAGTPNRNAVTNLAMWAFAHDRFFHCSSNMMTVDKPIPLTEARVSASLFGISPGSVFFGDDIDRMSPDRLALLKLVLPRLPGMPEPVDLFTKTDVREDFVRTFVLKIRKPWGSWNICAVFNLNDEQRQIKLDADLLRLDKDKKYRMYDFWEESYAGIFEGERSVQLEARYCKIIRFEEVHDHPWLLSTDMHIRQGQAEIDHLQWDEKTMTLSGTARRAPGERGSLLFAVPPRYIGKNFNAGLTTAKSCFDGTVIVKKNIEFTSATEDFSISFDLA